MSEASPDPRTTAPPDQAGDRHPSPRARTVAKVAGVVRSLVRPEGLPPEAGDELEAVFAGVLHEALASGPARWRRVRARARAAPPRLLDWMSGQVLVHPAVLYDVEGVELLAARQGNSIGAAMGAMQLALVAAAAASTLEGGPVLAVAIDGAVGQVAALVQGCCDWYNTGSFLVRRLHASGIAVDRSEVRRLTNAALASRGATVDEGSLTRATELRLIRSWMGRGLVDALPFGSRLGRASPRAAARIERSDLARLVQLVREGDALDPH